MSLKTSMSDKTAAAGGKTALDLLLFAKLVFSLAIYWLFYFYDLFQPTKKSGQTFQQLQPTCLAHSLKPVLGRPARLSCLET